MDNNWIISDKRFLKKRREIKKVFTLIFWVFLILSKKKSEKIQKISDSSFRSCNKERGKVREICEYCGAESMVVKESNELTENIVV